MDDRSHREFVPFLSAAWCSVHSAWSSFSTLVCIPALLPGQTLSIRPFCSAGVFLSVAALIWIAQRQFSLLCQGVVSSARSSADPVCDHAESQEEAMADIQV